MTFISAYLPFAGKVPSGRGTRPNPSPAYSFSTSPSEARSLCWSSVPTPPPLPEARLPPLLSFVGTSVDPCVERSVPLVLYVLGLRVYPSCLLLLHPPLPLSSLPCPSVSGSTDDLELGPPFRPSGRCRVSLVGRESRDSCQRGGENNVSRVVE